MKQLPKLAQLERAEYRGEKTFRLVIFENDPESGAMSVRDILEGPNAEILFKMADGNDCWALVPEYLAPQIFGAEKIGNHWGVQPSDPRASLPHKVLQRTCERILKLCEQFPTPSGPPFINDDERITSWINSIAYAARNPAVTIEQTEQSIRDLINHIKRG